MVYIASTAHVLFTHWNYLVQGVIVHEKQAEMLENYETVKNVFLKIDLLNGML